jgi:EmrB/QacA subfamily drug resistance transporter
MMFHKLHGTSVADDHPVEGAARSGHAPHHAPPSAAEPAGQSGDPRRWWVLGLLALAQFMLVIDVTVVNVALPSIGRDLALDRSLQTWIPTAYTLFFGSLLMLGGRLADTLGRRRVLMAGIVLFVAASIGSGISSSGEALVAFRALQGLGAALLSPSALSIVTTIFQGAERNRALSIWAAVGGSGAAVGVVFGGALTSGPGWQWIFFINVPVGILVLAGVARFVRPVAPPRAGRGVDLAGGLTIAAGIAALLWGVINAGDAGWTAVETLAAIAASIVLVGIFVHIERSTREPLIRLGMLRDAAFSGSVALMGTSMSLLAGMIFLSSLYLQLSVGLSALQTGLLFLPMSLALVLGTQLGVRFIGHAGARVAAAFGLVVAASGMAFLSRLPTSGDVLADVLPGLVVAGFGIGTTLVSAATTLFGRVGDGDAGLASGLMNTGHEVGFAVGVAALSTIGGAALFAGPGAAGGGLQAAFLACVAIAGLGVAIAAHTLPSVRPASTGRRIFAH